MIRAPHRPERPLLALRWALAVGAVGVTGCGPEAPPPDPSCGMPGVAADQPSLVCPEEVDLGCIDPEGAPVTLDVPAAACDGSDAVVVCEPGYFSPGADARGHCTATAPSGARADCQFSVRYRMSAGPELRCRPTVSAACDGPRTGVALPAPEPILSCDVEPSGPPVHDAPAGGFPLGTTAVTWRLANADGVDVTCDTLVDVTDREPPRLDCPAQAVVRTAAGVTVTARAPEAVDTCDPEVSVSVPALPQTRGRHTLAVTAADGSDNVGRCELDVAVWDLYPPEDLRVVSASLVADGSTEVTLGWGAGQGADVRALRLERASDPEGPWAEVMTSVAGADPTTFTDADALSPVGFYRLVAIGEAGVSPEGGASSPLRVHAVTADGYDLFDQAVPGLPFATSLVGVVRHPADLALGPYPLVLLMHGNHGNCRSADGERDLCETRSADACEDARFTTTPNAEGYIYLQDTLAAQGYVTVSVSANALNCRARFIGERAQLILEHLRRWSGWSGGVGAPFGDTYAGAVDLSRTALFGHSRGGEAVASAPAALRATPIPGVRLASVFAVGPTDYDSPTPSHVPFAVLLPGCDADVSTLEGLRHYDRGLSAMDGHARAQVLYVGANHNFFNTEWRTDDNEGRRRACLASEQVGGPAQRGMLEVVVSDWINAHRGATPLPAYQRAEIETPALIDAWADRSLDLRWSYAAPDRLTIDDFVGPSAPDVNDLDGANTFAGMIAAIRCTGSCARNFHHEVGAVRPAWQDAAASMDFGLGELDASPWYALSMRFAARIATINNGLTSHDLGIRIQDAAGVSAEVPLSRVGRLPNRYPSRFEQEILSTVRVPLAAFLDIEASIDLSRLAAVQLVMPIPSGNPAGSIWMSDLELTSR